MTSTYTLKTAKHYQRHFDGNPRLFRAVWREHCNVLDWLNRLAYFPL